MPLSGNRVRTYIPSLQTPIFLAQAAPVQNTWYTVTTTLYNLMLIMMDMWVATTGETLEMKVTLNGADQTLSQAANADTPYEAFFSSDTNANRLTMMTTQIGYRAHGVFARDFAMQVRKTTANGAGTLYGGVKYYYI